MGGGPASADVVRSSCIVTFPEATGEEPVPVDAWYLHAVGLPFLRRLARDRVGDDMRIALVLQQVDAQLGKRYVAVSSQQVLKQALEETFGQPDKVLVLHIVSLERVRGLKKIHVRPEINPNVSPEPVGPMGLVFPTLSVDGLMTPTAVVVPTAEPTDASLAYEVMRQSSFNFRKSIDVAGGKTLDDSTPFIEERDYTWRSTASSDRTATSGSDGSFTDATQSSNASSMSSLGGGSPSSSGSMASVIPEVTIVSAVPTTTAKSLDSASDTSEDDVADESAIPMARVVTASDVPVASAAAIPSDYVMLELQNGAGLPEAPAGASSTFFISSNWHVQADEMSASMRLEPLPDLSASRSGSFHRQQERAARLGGSGLDESFVLLDRSQS
jgi:hypothetical protein